MGYRVAVVGATGAVGREILKTLAERDFPVTEIAAVASARSTGQEVSFGDKAVLTTLVNILKDKDNKTLAVQAAVATALGYVGDQQDPLAALRGRDEKEKLIGDFAEHNDDAASFVSGIVEAR